MALSNVSDYQLFVNQLFFYIDNVVGGVDRERLPVYSDMTVADFQDRIAAYETYKKTRLARPLASELSPNAHGANGTTAIQG